MFYTKNLFSAFETRWRQSTTWETEGFKK